MDFLKYLRFVIFVDSPVHIVKHTVDSARAFEHA